MDNLGPAGPSSKKGSQHSGGVKVVVTQPSLHLVDLLVSKEDFIKRLTVAELLGEHRRTHRIGVFSGCVARFVSYIQPDVVRNTRITRSGLHLHPGWAV